MKSIKHKIKTLTIFDDGFTMIELVFVIVLVGILAGIGTSFMPDNRLWSDTNFLIMKIKQKQRVAIGYDVNGFSRPWNRENNSTCIIFDTKVLNAEDSHSSKPHKFSSTIQMNANHTLCFDEYGRPYHNGHLLMQNLDINLTLNSHLKQFSVMSMSGYVIIKK